MPIRRTAGKDISAAGGPAPRPQRKSETGTRKRSAAEGAAARASRTEPHGVAGQSVDGDARDLEPSPAEIERLAYSYWLARGRQGGSPEADWFRAEQELRNRAAAAVGA